MKNKIALQKKNNKIATLKKNFPSIIKEKLRYSFTTRPACLARNVQGCPEGWNERTLNDNSKLYEEINILVKIWAIIKASTIVKLVCNSTFYFTHALWDKYLYFKLLVYKLVICFPGGSDGKESIYNAGDLGLIPKLGRSPNFSL